MVATAELEGGVYRVRSPRTVGEVGGLIERMGLTAAAGRSTLLGFDFPIGIPRAYALRAGIANFAVWFRNLDLDSPFFSVATISRTSRPSDRSFPDRLRSGSRASRSATAKRSGSRLTTLSARPIERTVTARAASEMFWTLGPSAVGKATLAGWRDTIRPALAETAGAIRSGRSTARYRTYSARPTL